MNSVKIDHLFDASDVDFLGKAKIDSVQRVFQSAAAEDCRRLGVGTKDLAEKNRGWILSRMRYGFKRFPKLDDTITFETWQTKPGGCEFIRVVKLTDESGELVADGISRWCVMDLSSARLVPASNVDMDRSEPFCEDNPFGDDFKKLICGGEWTLKFSEKVGLSKIDINRHLNNTRYFEFVFDCFGSEEYKNIEIEDFQIDFRSQVTEGEIVEVYMRKENRDYWFKGEVNGNIVFVARMRTKA